MVVDNASSRTARAKSSARPRVRLIANPWNRGFAAAANQGIGALDCECVLLLNPDVELLAGVSTLWRLPAHRPNSPPPAGNSLATTDVLNKDSCSEAFQHRLRWHSKSSGSTGCGAATPSTGATVASMPIRSVAGGSRTAGRCNADDPARGVARTRRVRRVIPPGLVRGCGLSASVRPRPVIAFATCPRPWPNTRARTRFRRLPAESRELYWYGNLLRYAARHFLTQRSPGCMFWR